MGTTDRLLLFLDFEGTICTSRERHYVQYCEALETLRQTLNLEDEKGLIPISRKDFLAKYDSVSKYSELLPLTDAKSLEGKLARATFEREYSRILWQYSSEHQALEQILPGVLEALERLCRSAHCVIVSYTRQDQTEFCEHLQRLQVVAPGRICPEDVYCVGQDGRSSNQAKVELIKQRFGSEIEAQKARGSKPTYFGDATGDMEAAAEVGIGFVGLTDTGKSRRSEFEDALRHHGGPGPVAFFSALGSNECVEYAETLGQR